MFGYVMPKECELKVREQAVYRSCYCGLCKSLRKHFGPVSACFLTYDCTFLAILFSALSEESVTTAPCRCLHKCGTGKRRFRNDSPALTFAAAVNVLLSDAKLRDDIRDGGGLKARLGHFVLKSAVRRAKKSFPGLAEETDRYLAAQTEVESNHSCADAAADPTGSFLRSLPAHYGQLKESERPVAEWLLYHLGRWIYFADAAADMQEDVAAGRFNAFTGADAPDPGFCLRASLNECEKALFLLSPRRDGGLLDNILRLGCAAKTAEILQKGTEPVHESV